MSERIVLLFLIPLVPLLIWGIRRLKFAERAMAVLGIVTTLAVWGILYVSCCMDIFPPDAGAAFRSVEYLQREVPLDWLLRYAVPRFGWIAGVVLFFGCWGAAKRLSSGPP